MSVHEISELRKSGYLDEALRLAKNELRDHPQSPWAASALFWVLRDLCRHRYIPSRQLAALQQALQRMDILLQSMHDEEKIGLKELHRLQLHLQPEAATLVSASVLSRSDPVRAYHLVESYIASPDTLDAGWHTELGWILFRYLRSFCDGLSVSRLSHLLRDYLLLSNERPSLLHSQILHQALLQAQRTPNFNFYQFFILWNPRLLRPKDLQPGNFEGRNTRPFIARIFSQLIAGGYQISIDRLCQEINLEPQQIIEYLREACFWQLWKLYKEGQHRVFHEALITYAEVYAAYGPSYWHTEILKCAEFVYQEEYNPHFLYFFKAWGSHNLRPEDWLRTHQRNGTVRPSLAQRAAHLCVECVKSLHIEDDEILTWLSAFLDEFLVKCEK